jgi:P4 family phage/plasmid primase-like protien
VEAKMTEKFKFKAYDEERYSKTEWSYHCLNKFGFDIGLQVRKQGTNGEIYSSLKFYQRKIIKDKEMGRVALEELNPEDIFFMYRNKKGKITKEDFIKNANDGDTILLHWIVIDSDFNHEPINFQDDNNPLFKILKKFDEEGLKYILFGTEEGRGLKIVFPFKELLNNPDNDLKQRIGEYIISFFDEGQKPEIKLSGVNCSFCFPAKEGEEPVHAKTGNPIKILHFTGLDNSLNNILEKLPKDEKNKPSEEFIKNIYFDNHGIFWIWDEDNLKWGMKDDIDVLNLFEQNNWETKKQKNKSYILNIAKQDGRKNRPLELSPFSICFKNIIYDLKNKQEVPITKKYFITSPIPYDLSNSSETPTIDKFFIEWVGEDKKENLYEIIAYSICQEQFLQRWFALTGAGSNGKGTFNNLIMKFIGKDNCVSSSIKALINRTFETSALYKKLVCFIGEADSSDLSNTNIIKQLTGEDLIRFEFKGKTCFSDSSPTTFIMNTNSLPKTPDKSDGFYRRVFVIPFPNQFKITPNLLDKIPDEEFENLTRKIVNVLLELIEKNKFSNEGEIEDRRKIYEEHSSPLMIFISENYEEDGSGFCKLREFSKEYNQFRKNKKLRVLTIHQIGKELREEGFEISARKYKNDDGEIFDSAKSIIGLTKDGFQQVSKNSSLGSNEKEGFQYVKEKGSLSSNSNETTQTTKIPYILENLSKVEEKIDFSELDEVIKNG